MWLTSSGVRRSPSCTTCADSRFDDVQLALMHVPVCACMLAVLRLAGLVRLSILLLVWLLGFCLAAFLAFLAWLGL